MTMSQTLKIDERLIGGITANALGPLSDAVQNAFDQKAIAEREMQEHMVQCHRHCNTDPLAAT